MNPYKPVLSNSFTKTAIAVLFGITAAIILFVLLTHLSVTLGLFGWSNAKDESLVLTTNLSIVLSIGLSSFAAAYITSIQSQSSLAYFITGTLVIMGLCLIIEDRFFQLTSYEYVSFVTSILGTVAGGSAGLSKDQESAY